MFTVEEVAHNLTVSKVTVYKKLKKYETKVVIRQGRKYITEDLFKLIKEELKVKNEVKSKVKNKESENLANQEIAIDTEGLVKLNSELNMELIDLLREQLKEKDIQLKEKDKQIQELIALNKNNQVLLKQQQDKEINELKLEEHFKEFDNKLVDLKNKMDNKKKENKRLFKFFSK